jgi:site-specific DNA recombinase
MTAAIYARKSTDQAGVADEQRSVARQVEHARAYAEHKGWTVADAHVYADDGISGAEFARRPGLQRLLAAVKVRTPFDVLVISELSRLGREQIETQGLLKTLSQAGVRVFLYLEDRELSVANPTDKLMNSMTSFADELEREKARQRTYDALQRKARVGHVTGGRVFGYRNVDVLAGTDVHGRPIRSHVVREIHEAEALVVRQIFQLCAEGFGITTIAKRLNADGALTPRAQRGRPAAWAPSSVREILHRPLYRGEIVWNQTRKREPWGQVRQTARPASEWLRRPSPELRIVSDEAWTAAHARLATVRREYLRATDGKLCGKPPKGGESKYLLTGFAVCGLCGHSMMVLSRAHGRQRSFRYGCSGYHRRGTSVCTNRHETLMTAADAGLLERLGAILTPDVVEEAIAAAVDRLKPTLEARLEARQTLQAELEGVDTEIGRLVAAVTTGGTLPGLLEALRTREARRAALQTELTAIDQQAAVLRVEWGSVRDRLAARAAEWLAMSRAHVPQARQLIRKLLVGPITLTPTASGGYSCEGEASFTRFLFGILDPLSVASPTGFEPVF